VVLPAQSRGGDLLRRGREELAARHLEAADSLLKAALDTANHLSDIDRQGAYVWLGITEYYRGGDSLARAAFHEALALNPDIQVGGLSGLDPHLGELFEQERQAVRDAMLVYLAQAVDVKPQRLSGPPLRPPSGGHAPPGLAIVTVIVDTLGRAEPENIAVVSISDSAWVQPVKEMLRNSQYSVGRVRGRAVRTEIGLSVPLQVSPVNPVELVTAARTLLGSQHTDSALNLLRLALDSSAHPTDAQRVYGLLVRGMAWKAAGRDSLASRRAWRGIVISPPAVWIWRPF
jgi:tetratricopeptide (TPR) repeat protein